MENFASTFPSQRSQIGTCWSYWRTLIAMPHTSLACSKKMLQPKSSCQTWRAAAPALVCAFGGSSREPVKNSNLAQRLFKQQSGFSFPVAVSIYRRKSHFEEFIENKIFAAPTKRLLKLHAAGLKPCFVFPTRQVRAVRFYQRYRMQDRMLENISERMAGRMPHRLPERMPDRLPERMSECVSNMYDNIVYYIYTYIYIHIYIHTYIYIYVFFDMPWWGSL